MIEKVRITIRGAVQGVGFRPFVYRLACALALQGWVLNGGEGVLIEAEGEKETLDEFIERLESERPERASIQSLEYSFAEARGLKGFTIRTSELRGGKTAFLLPDIATCADCLGEILDPENRRYGYPFTNCTNCGPRFTIVERLPYDRANTTMNRFTMCEACCAEYEDPLDRRFHAQPNACPECGPRLELWDVHGRVLSHGERALHDAAELLCWGRIVAVKGIGGFQLMTDASSDAAVLRLRQRKHREEKPFAVMVPSMESVHSLCNVDRLEQRALRSPEAPIVLLSRRDHLLDDNLSRWAAPGNPYLGVMLPYSPLHHLLMRRVGEALIATSGNRNDEPICIAEQDAIERLRGIADAFLVHNRPIRRHADDSIVRILLGRQQVLRRARGFAPFPITVKQTLPLTLAVGAQVKNSIALAIPSATGNQTNIFVSQHIGDLETKEALAAFQGAIADLETLYDAGAAEVACDLHPDYSATRAAPRARRFRIQHHFAHVAACMAENDIDGTALGVAWDGTGYGLDGTIWGGEFILARGHQFERFAHFRTFCLPGGEAAIRKPAQTALGLKYELLGNDAFDGKESALVRGMLQQQFQTPRTSSVGRLFDAVAFLTGLCNRISFEGQAGMALEFAVDRRISDWYPYTILAGLPMVVDWAPMLRVILEEVRNGVPAGTISAKFHNTLCETVPDIARRSGQRTIVLTGGCFQNKYLTERVVQRLKEESFVPYWHQRVPPNDGGLALGQAVAARAQERLCVSQYRAG